MKALREEAELALKLADLRKSSGLTQVDLAARLGCTQPQVARMERKGYWGTIRTVSEFVTACGKKLVIGFKQALMGAAGKELRQLRGRWMTGGGSAGPVPV
jgi:transcriptional regulator with XRE-family HTH domain